MCLFNKGKNLSAPIRRITPNFACPILSKPVISDTSYDDLERLAKASKGAYLAPLRLLALEGRDRLQGRGVACLRWGAWMRSMVG